MTKKQHVYSTSNTNSIGVMDVLDVDTEPTQPPPKHLKTAGSSSSHGVQFDGVELYEQSNLTPKPTRQSMQSAKANSKKDVRELFGQLAKEFQVISKTCKEIAEAME
jgi:hypothetical protein